MPKKKRDKHLSSKEKKGQTFASKSTKQSFRSNCCFLKSNQRIELRDCCIGLGPLTNQTTQHTHNTTLIFSITKSKYSSSIWRIKVSLNLGLMGLFLAFQLQAFGQCFGNIKCVDNEWMQTMLNDSLDNKTHFKVPNLLIHQSVQT